jgi:hypothetical protein
MAYAPPNPKRVAFDKRRVEVRQQIESCYRMHTTPQARELRRKEAVR